MSSHPHSGYVHDLEPGDVVSYLHRGASGVVRLPESGLAVLSCERRSDGSWMLILEGWGPAAKDVDFNGHDAATYTTDRDGPWNKCHLHE